MKATPGAQSTSHGDLSRTDHPRPAHAFLVARSGSRCCRPMGPPISRFRFPDPPRRSVPLTPPVRSGRRPSSCPRAGTARQRSAPTPLRPARRTRPPSPQKMPFRTNPRHPSSRVDPHQSARGPHHRVSETGREVPSRSRSDARDFPVDREVPMRPGPSCPQGDRPIRIPRRGFLKFYENSRVRRRQKRPSVRPKHETRKRNHSAGLA